MSSTYSMVESLREVLKGKVLILCIGNPFRCDDGAGPLLISYLKGQIGETLLDVGEEPLNYLGVIESQKPNTILVFDTAEMGEEPGSIKKLDTDELSQSTTVSTHSIPIHQILKLIETRTGADLVLFGVQPHTIELGNRISPQVRDTVKKFSKELVQALQEREGL